MRPPPSPLQQHYHHLLPSAQHFAAADAEPELLVGPKERRSLGAAIGGDLAGIDAQADAGGGPGSAPFYNYIRFGR